MGNVYTGTLGVVLLPNKDTHTTAIALSRGLNQDGALIDLSGEHQPHLTLYHAPMAKVPEERVFEFLSFLRNRLPVSVHLTGVNPFGKKFAFWDVDPSEILTFLHTGIVLRLKEFFVHEATPPSAKEGLQLSRAEQDNVRLYGHPLVFKLWRPHITLGAREGGYIQSQQPQYSFHGGFERAAFVQVGPNGTIAEIFAVS